MRSENQEYCKQKDFKYLLYYLIKSESRAILSNQLFQQNLSIYIQLWILLCMSAHMTTSWCAFTSYLN